MSSTESTAERRRRPPATPPSRHRPSRSRLLTVGASAVAAATMVALPATALTAPAVNESSVTGSAGPASGSRGAPVLDAAAGSPTGRAATRAARELADGSATTVPAALVPALGYRPTTALGQPADGDGECSSPVPLPARFEPACRIHDLGYDLLRVAHAEGTPLPDGLRAALDARLADHLHESCGSRMRCHVAATVADVAVRANTIRQSGGAPVVEKVPW